MTFSKYILAAVASLMAHSVAAQQTSLYIPGINKDWHPSGSYKGRVLGGDDVAKTYSLECVTPDGDDGCYAPPSFHLTEGPSTMAYTWDMGNDALATADCKLGGGMATCFAVTAYPNVTPPSADFTDTITYLAVSIVGSGPATATATATAAPSAGVSGAGSAGAQVSGSAGAPSPSVNAGAAQITAMAGFGGVMAALAAAAVVA